jgi:hypothetical protein
MRAGRRHQRYLVDVLVVELGIDRRLAGEHHHRQAGAHRGRQRRHQLGHTRTAGDRRRGDIAGGDVVGRGSCDSAVLVPHVDGLHTGQAGKGCRPVHITVSHQSELRVDALREKRFREGFIELCHGAQDHLDERCSLAVCPLKQQLQRPPSRLGF